MTLLSSIYTLLGIGAMFVGIIGWAFRLEGRVNTQAQQHCDLKEFIEKLMNAKFEAMDQRLERIERNGNGRPKE